MHSSLFHLLGAGRTPTDKVGTGGALPLKLHSQSPIQMPIPLLADYPIAIEKLWDGLTNPFLT
jgi:hypothetical protein